MHMSTRHSTSLHKRPLWPPLRCLLHQHHSAFLISAHKYISHFVNRSSTFPWWSIMIIVLVVIIAAGIFFWCFRRWRRRQNAVDADQLLPLNSHNAQHPGSQSPATQHSTSHQSTPFMASVSLEQVSGSSLSSECDHQQPSELASVWLLGQSLPEHGRTTPTSLRQRNNTPQPFTDEGDGDHLPADVHARIKTQRARTNSFATTDTLMWSVDQ